MNKVFLKISEVKNITGFSRSTIYRRMNQGDFPRQISLGGNTIRWSVKEIKEWVENKIKNSKKDQEED